MLLFSCDLDDLANLSIKLSSLFTNMRIYYKNKLFTHINLAQYLIVFRFEYLQISKNKISL